MKIIFLVILVAFLFAGLTIAQNNNATVNQTGLNSNAAITQMGSENNAVSTQNGDVNFAEINQTGSLNEAAITSNGDHNVVRWQIIHNFYVPHSGISYLGGVLTDGINQVGSSNKGIVTQTGDYNWAGIGQYSDNNQASITQIEAGFLTANYAAVDQMNGNNNVSEQIQNAVDAESFIHQSGSSNFAHAEQYQNIGGLYYGGMAELVQDGNNNSAVQFQIGCPVSYDGSKVNASAFQIGNSNYAVQNQNGGCNTSLITSIGNFNGISGDEIKTDQTGRFNSASIEEGLLGAINSNLASILQTGDSNTATVSHEGGDSNVARVSQTSDSNTAHVTQNGSNNSSNVTQH